MIEFDLEDLLKEGVTNKDTSDQVDLSYLEAMAQPQPENDVGNIIETEVLDLLLPVLRDKILSLEKPNQGAMLAADMSKDVIEALILLNKTVRELGSEQARAVLLNLRPVKIYYLWIETVKYFLNSKCLESNVEASCSKTKHRSKILLECEKFLSVTGQLMEEKKALQNQNQKLRNDIIQWESRYNDKARESMQLQNALSVTRKQLEVTETELGGEKELSKQTQYKVEELQEIIRSHPPTKVEKHPQKPVIDESSIELMLSLAEMLSEKGEVPEKMRQQLKDTVETSCSSKNRRRGRVLLERKAPTPPTQPKASSSSMSLCEPSVGDKRKHNKVVEGGVKFHDYEMKSIENFYRVPAILSPMPPTPPPIFSGVAEQSILNQCLPNDQIGGNTASCSGHGDPVPAPSGWGKPYYRSSWKKKDEGCTDSSHPKNPVKKTLQKQTPPSQELITLSDDSEDLHEKDNESVTCKMCDANFMNNEMLIAHLYWHVHPN